MLWRDEMKMALLDRLREKGPVLRVKKYTKTANISWGESLVSGRDLCLLKDAFEFFGFGYLSSLYDEARNNKILPRRSWLSQGTCGAWYACPIEIHKDVVAFIQKVHRYYRNAR
jgi:hypothetical protein